jgi:hypothetical protein
MVSVELFLFQDEPELPTRELLELATGEETKRLFAGCSCIMDMMDQFMRSGVAVPWI